MAETVAMLRSHWARVAEVGPHAGAHRAALRAGVAMLVPLALVWWCGRPDLLQYAAIGAFVSLYGRACSLPERLRMQTSVAVVLVVAVTVGALVSTTSCRTWILVPLAAGWAGLAVLLSTLGGWHPAGALNPVFALTASATVPVAPGSVPAAVAAVAGAACWTLAVTWASGRRGVRPDGCEPARSHPRVGLRSRLRQAWSDGLTPRHVARYVLAIGAAGLVAASTGIGHPYWLFVTASVPMSAPDLHGRIVRASQRVVGTGVGLGTAALVLRAHPTGYLAVLVIAALQAATELTTMRNYSIGLIFFTPMALLLGDIMLPGSIGQLLSQRAIETALGLALALAATLLTHERRTPPPASREATEMTNGPTFP